MSSEAKWRDITAEGGRDCDGNNLEMKMGTVAIIDHEEAQSTYAFNAILSYVVSPSGAKVSLSSCSAHGTCLDGMDRGSVAYTSTGPWVTEVVDATAFEARGEVIWTDRFNDKVRIPLSLKGRVAATGRLDQVVTAFEGLAKYDPDAMEELLMEVPAVW